jgi:predicted Zn-dependent protease
MSGVPSNFTEALSNARDLARQGQRDQAIRQLELILSAAPGEVNSLCLLGSLRAEQDRIGEALDLLQQATRAAPDFDTAWIELARVQRYAEQKDAAISSLQALTRRAPNHSLAWRLLGDALCEHGRYPEGRAAFARAANTDPHRPAMADAIQAMNAGRDEAAVTALRAIRQADPSHVYSALALASLALDRGRVPEADQALSDARALTTHLDPVWRLTTRLHFQRSDYRRAEAAAQRLVAIAPDIAGSWAMLGDVKAWGLRNAEAVSALEKALELDPSHAQVWMALGHAFKAAGRREDSEKAYHEAIKLDPALGEAWWSLADLKTYTFAAGELGAVRRGAAAPDGSPFNRAGFQFALGKALEDQQEFDAAFDAYGAGNALKHATDPFDIDAFEAHCAATKALFSDGLPARIPGAAPWTPIFIVGLPRAGSTLLEQILASHTQVEATAELPHMVDMARDLRDQVSYPDALATLGEEAFADIGGRYLYDTEPFRGSSTYFIDKTPNNFAHAGLIARALPNAIIIDARRDPRDCGVSAWKQNFARGQTFSNDLEILARYYRAYADLMDHFAATSPGRIIKVQYEDVVEDAEAQIRTLLDACGLPFEDACLRFWETRRPINTPSAEQVRQPVYARSIGSWRRFESRLGPFLDALGDRAEG